MPEYINDSANKALFGYVSHVIECILVWETYTSESRTRFGILVVKLAHDRVFREILLGDEYVLDMYLNQINPQSKDIIYALRDSTRYWESR